MSRFIVLLVLALVAGCNQTPIPEGVGESVIVGADEVTQAAFNPDGLPTVSFDVPGMHCEVMCTPKVRETLAAQPGVKDVQVDLESKTATVAVDSNEEFDSEQAVAALKAADFSDSSVKEQS